MHDITEMLGFVHLHNCKGLTIHDITTKLKKCHSAQISEKNLLQQKAPQTGVLNNEQQQLCKYTQNSQQLFWAKQCNMINPSSGGKDKHKCSKTATLQLFL